MPSRQPWLISKGETSSLAGTAFIAQQTGYIFQQYKSSCSAPKGVSMHPNKQHLSLNRNTITWQHLAMTELVLWCGSWQRSSCPPRIHTVHLRPMHCLHSLGCCRPNNSRGVWPVIGGIILRASCRNKYTDLCTDWLAVWPRHTINIHVYMFPVVIIPNNLSYNNTQGICKVVYH
jgi:hypothetical protein